MDKADRERFEALIAAKRDKGKGGNKAGHDDDRHSHEQSAKVHQQFKRRKV